MQNRMLFTWKVLCLCVALWSKDIGMCKFDEKIILHVQSIFFHLFYFKSRREQSTQGLVYTLSFPYPLATLVKSNQVPRSREDAHW